MNLLVCLFICLFVCLCVCLLNNMTIEDSTCLRWRFPRSQSTFLSTSLVSRATEREGYSSPSTSLQSVCLPCGLCEEGGRCEGVGGEGCGVTAGEERGGGGTLGTHLSSLSIILRAVTTFLGSLVTSCVVWCITSHRCCPRAS